MDDLFFYAPPRIAGKTSRPPPRIAGAGRVLPRIGTSSGRDLARIGTSSGRDLARGGTSSGHALPRIGIDARTLAAAAASRAMWQSEAGARGAVSQWRRLSPEEKLVRALAVLDAALGLAHRGGIWSQSDWPLRTTRAGRFTIIYSVTPPAMLGSRSVVTIHPRATGRMDEFPGSIRSIEIWNGHGRRACIAWRAGGAPEIVSFRPGKWECRLVELAQSPMTVR